ncbi:37S ribosomal protein S10, mitochondrial [Sphaceloma murrayae]|uniref:Small ribosomal subunit protein uS10m n=1 Tax=Sphaceloma murrayae TaxID=2082308 RepID=A0A2K1QLW6_9PEZI|nr:37S ribosomal protein S10, mitochondrial [Sphaceloma murrayae]
MALPSYLRSPFGLAKRLKVAPPQISSQARSVYQSRQPFNAEPSPILEHYREADDAFDDKMSEAAEEARGVTLPLRSYKLPPSVQEEVDALRLPRSVQLTYLNPLKRQPKYGIPVADLQLRSYSVRNLEFMADFALRAAYYLNLPAKGAVPLPRITERWTVPKSNFVHKKSQENFERITMRRLIQIQDGHPETVQIWLGFLQKYMYYGVGMKANVWEYGEVDVGAEMDKTANEVRERVRERLKLFGRRKDLVGKKDVKHLVHDSLFKGAYGSLGPMGSSNYGHI